ncbi:hypothetical protein MPDQ_000503 [Monascus purpureus]|uniref:Uncharacterized protein n=1 Tax=Monascus purpureus TaxID=5098 RepID=A0A507R4E4_MONPU|nr:hypothetical protein MPDQ_000503 [Monascus purpureus]BDD64077.1 hypothetical protein MAP00_008923 [Monascus purpureus]
MAPERPVLPPLETPKHTTFPLEIHGGNRDNSRRPGNKSAPITPPAAYTEFLRALTPVFSSPPSAGASVASLKFEPSSAAGRSWTLNTPSSTTSSLPPPTPFSGPLSASTWSTSQPGSEVSGSLSSCGDPLRSAPLSSSSLPPLPPCTALLPPDIKSTDNSDHGACSARHPRVPHSLKLPPLSASCRPPRSATSLRSPLSLSAWKLRRSDQPRPVSVTQVITRTVTFKHTQLQAPPKGRRGRYREVKAC